MKLKPSVFVLRKTISLTFLSIMLCMSCDTNKESQNIQTIVELKNRFFDPPSEYRSAPLWSWNEEITKEGIDFQMQEFKRAGIGGVFVHPRPGLLTEYFSEEWFHLFDYTVQKGRQLDIKVWIYDENSYPSGFAGGHVPAEMPDSYQHGTGLKLNVTNILNITLSDTIAVVLKKTEHGFNDVTATLDEEFGKQGTFYIFKKTYPLKRNWHGGFSYVDLIYNGVTDKFIELTMTNGYDRNMTEYGTTIPGIFTDEPNLEAALSDGAIMRWTPDLWDTFMQRWGYDLRLNLPSLVEKTGNWRKVRHNYYQHLLELFINRWAKPWSEYCDKNNLIWTGHYHEHSWPEPTLGFDEAAMYIYHQMPGVDMLGHILEPFGQGMHFGNDRAIRELISAANQSGRNRTLSETYGGGGWEMSFKTQKRLVDWQCALGVNFINQHMSYYSLNGVRKFDHPPSFSYHQPWWDHYKLMGDYIGRISMSLSSGNQINNTLLLQPNTSAWLYFSRRDKDSRVNEIGKGFKDFIYQLEQNHIEYDLGSEYVMKELGSVVDRNLRVGQRDYDLLIIPSEMENLNRSTYELLKEYCKNGGRVLSFSRSIPFINGAESDEVEVLAKHYHKQWINTTNLDDSKVLKLLSRDNFLINDKTKNGMLYHQRRFMNDGQLLFIVNSHQNENASVEVMLKGKYVTYMDLLTGKIYTYPSEVDQGNVRFSFNLESIGSALFAITNKKITELNYSPIVGVETEIKANGSIQVKREKDNVLKVNYLDIKTTNSELKDVYFMNATNYLYLENGIEMGNPWQHKIQYKQNHLALDTLFDEKSMFEVDYHFYIDENLKHLKRDSIRAVVERPGIGKIFVNGKMIEKIPGTWWIDKDFPVYNIGKFLNHGKNTITLKASRMHILTEVMPVYILGDFLVKPGDQGFKISGGDIKFPGSWRNAGLPFYPHSVIYSQIFDIKKTGDTKYMVQLGKWNGTLCEVLINDQSAGIISWQPYEMEVTDFLKNGSNKVAVRIFGSLKNTFGFFYHNNMNRHYWGPGAWNTGPEKIPTASEYFLMDYGLFEPFKVITFN